MAVHGGGYFLLHAKVQTLSWHGVTVMHAVATAVQQQQSRESPSLEGACSYPSKDGTTAITFRLWGPLSLPCARWRSTALASLPSRFRRWPAPSAAAPSPTANLPQKRRQKRNQTTKTKTIFNATAVRWWAFITYRRDNTIIYSSTLHLCDNCLTLHLCDNCSSSTLFCEGTDSASARSQRARLETQRDGPVTCGEAAGEEITGRSILIPEMWSIGDYTQKKLYSSIYTSYVQNCVTTSFMCVCDWQLL